MVSWLRRPPLWRPLDGWVFYTLLTFPFAKPHFSSCSLPAVQSGARAHQIFPLTLKFPKPLGTDQKLIHQSHSICYIPWVTNRDSHSTFFPAFLPFINLILPDSKHNIESRRTHVNENNWLPSMEVAYLEQDVRFEGTNSITSYSRKALNITPLGLCLETLRWTGYSHIVMGTHLNRKSWVKVF